MCFFDVHVAYLFQFQPNGILFYLHSIHFYVGKGGTVGRGGNPALYRTVLSHPPNTINGRFRVTEQGEMITQNFGSIQIAERTLDIYTAAVLRESFIQHVEPTKE